ncbi:MAG: hypothetical protein FWG53_00025, partial [Clostridiales bacterium]|nr:hypothetical protein [Clostridiales bacterium]
MNKKIRKFDLLFERVWNKIHMGMLKKLIVTFMLVMILPLIALIFIAWNQILSLGGSLRGEAVNDSIAALNESAVKNIERLSTDTAKKLADFLYYRDDDIRYLSSIDPSEGAYRRFVESKSGRVVDERDARLFYDGKLWVFAEPPPPAGTPPSAWAGGVSQNDENNDRNGFHYFKPTQFTYKYVPLYDEITFVDLEGNELIKVVPSGSTKKNYPLDSAKKNVSIRENTYIKAESYFEDLKGLQVGDIYVSDVIGAYVPSNFIGMYTPENVANASAELGYEIDYNPEGQAYAGWENPKGQHFEGIIRWATPVAGEDGEKIGYVTFALNHAHIMEFADHITPMDERYVEKPSANEGNYALIWDYQCRNICHPRHHSITGFDPETGKRQVPWLEASIYEAWQASGIEDWTDFVAGIPQFDNQSRDKKPAAELTREGLVGLDGRYLNNAPQCIGWMDLTADGGSGSFYILWSGLYKINAAAAIPYYTGQFAPTLDNGYSKRGFGFVVVGASIDDFTRPATLMED